MLYLPAFVSCVVGRVGDDNTVEIELVHKEVGRM